MFLARLRNSRISIRSAFVLYRVDFVRVTGGEFGKERKKNNFDMYVFLNSKNWVSEEPLIVMLSQTYILGIEVLRIVLN